MRNKITNDVIDQIINIRSPNHMIKRLDNYINQYIKMSWQCMVCFHIWQTSVGNIIYRNSGCPQCSGQVKLTNESVDARLKDRLVKRIGEYNGKDYPIEWKCLINSCNTIWMTSPGNVLNRNSGCPTCSVAVRTFTNEIIDEILMNKSIKRLDQYQNSKTPLTFQCNDCNNVWRALPTSIIHANTGCPKCNVPGDNQKLMWEVLEQNNIEFRHEYSIKNIDNDTDYRYKVDAYIKKFNLIIELNGKQHYEPVCFGGCSQEQAKINFQKQKIRDEALEIFCKTHSIELIWIDGRVYKGNKLKEFIINTINNYS